MNGGFALAVHPEASKGKHSDLKFENQVGS